MQAQQQHESRLWYIMARRPDATPVSSDNSRTASVVALLAIFGCAPQNLESWNRGIESVVVLKAGSFVISDQLLFALLERMAGKA